MTARSRRSREAVPSRLPAAALAPGYRPRAEGEGTAMADMRLIVAGAGGRMGRTLTRVISETPGAVLTGALEAPGSALLGKDAGVLAGLPENGVKLSADLWSLSANADGILDFTVPGRDHRQCRDRRQARPRPRHRHHRPFGVGRRRDQERHHARDRREVRQYEPRRQSAGGAGQARGAIARRRVSTSKSWRCITAPRSTRRRAPRLLLGRGGGRRPRHRSAQPIRRAAATASPARGRPAISALRRCAAAPSSAITA